MNKYIQKLIKEQFSISDLDFSDDDQGYSTNIFSKDYNHPYYHKVLNGTITESEIKELNSLVGVAIPKDKDELRKIIEFYSKNYTKDSLNWLNVSGITDMSKLFSGEISFKNRNKYNGDISKWDTSNVTDMSYMFQYAKEFNQPIGSWDVSNVTNMSYMLCNAENFNQDISRWDVSNVTYMKEMFDYCPIEEKYKPKFK